MVRFLLDYNHIDYGKANGAKVAGAPLGVPWAPTSTRSRSAAQVAF